MGLGNICWLNEDIADRLARHYKLSAKDRDALHAVLSSLIKKGVTAAGAILLTCRRLRISYRVGGRTLWLRFDGDARTGASLLFELEDHTSHFLGDGGAVLLRLDEA